eukprot:Em0008g204a
MCYAVSTRSDPEENDGVDECAVPRFGVTPSYDIPSCPVELQAVVDEYRQLFSTVPGFTDLTHHTIPMASKPPVCVPPHCIPAQYREEIERQLQEMQHHQREQQSMASTCSGAEQEDDERCIPTSKSFWAVEFNWEENCQQSFQVLKDALTQVPVLCYPKKGFTLQTDASAVEIGAVLEQEGHVIAYASRSLTPPERQYSVIESECLAVVFAVKYFRHYLLERPFSLHTDHQPLQWLSAQKMEGRLCRWALALQEFDFEIKYR